MKKRKKHIKSSRKKFIILIFMKKTFYLFRHGETEYNRLKLRQGQGINIGLNATGFAQAEKLAQNSLTLGIEVIYTSPLVRARETADIVARYTGAPVKILPALTEGCFGLAEGLPNDEVKKRWPEILDDWYQTNQQMDSGFPEGETKRQIQQRVFQAMESLLNTPEKVIAVSSHSAALRFFLMAIGAGQSKLPNARLIPLTWEDGNWTAL